MAQNENIVTLQPEPAERPGWFSTRRARKKLLDWITHLVLTIGAIGFIFPFVWMIVRSVTPSAEIFGTRLFPTSISWEHFTQIFTRNNFGVYFWNSAVVCFFTVTLGLFFDSLAGFALAKGSFPGREKLFWLILSTMMIPVYTTLIPTFIILNDLRLRDTLYALIVPAVASAAGIFIMTQNIRTVPDALIEAAKVDGCGLFTIYTHMVLPMIRPALGALAIIRFLGSWNSYLIPLIAISEDSNKTIPLGLMTLFYQHGLVRWGALMAGSFAATLPLIVFFLVMQKQFISGITLGATSD